MTFGVLYWGYMILLVDCTYVNFNHLIRVTAAKSPTALVLPLSVLHKCFVSSVLALLSLN